MRMGEDSGYGRGEYFFAERSDGAIGLPLNAKPHTFVVGMSVGQKIALPSREAGAGSADRDDKIEP